jgi:ribose transport system ATP-binding protein
LLNLQSITKRFAGVTALEKVSLDLADGEVVAVIGENGAGKSTLMKVLSGVHQPDDGTILLDGKPIRFSSPREALDAGIRIIYQELSVLENLSVGANIFLGREFKKGLMVDESRTERESRQILDKVGLRVEPNRLVSSLSIAERQLVEIGRALSFRVRILILDEPTSSLTLEETQRLLSLVSDLRSKGVAILYITHRLDEIPLIADRVVALRDGKNSGALSKSDISKSAMVELMVGRAIQREEYVAQDKGAAVMQLSNVRTRRYPEQSVNFTIYEGEILGMAGLVGAGRTELARSIFGIDNFNGSVKIQSQEIKLSSPEKAIQAGIFLAPEDRRGCGLTVQMSVKDNASMPNLKALTSSGLINKHLERTYAKKIVESLGVKAESVETSIANLSGGNQQKVVLGRWMALKPKVFIVDEPTRGVDVGAKAEIYAQLREIAKSGTAVWMISSDMEEILMVSDRIAVMHEGRVAGILSRHEATEEKVMTLATGGQI